MGWVKGLKSAVPLAKPLAAPRRGPSIPAGPKSRTTKARASNRLFKLHRPRDLHWPALTLALVLVLGGCAAIQSTRDVAAPYYAKELCSCLFVVGQPAEACLDYVRYDLAALDEVPIIDTADDATIDWNARSVTVALLLNRATARYQDDRLGCRLAP